jgi:hypothetical protein
MRAYSIAVAMLLTSSVDAIKINKPIEFAQQKSKTRVVLHNRISRKEISGFAQAFRE